MNAFETSITSCCHNLQLLFHKKKKKTYIQLNYSARIGNEDLHEYGEEHANVWMTLSLCG